MLQNALGDGSGMSASARHMRYPKSIEVGAVLLAIVGLGACALLLAWLAHLRAPDDARAAIDCGALGRGAITCDRHAANDAQASSRGFDCAIFGKGGRICSERP